MLLTGCFCIGPGIDSRLAVLPILLTENLYQGQYKSSKFVGLFKIIQQGRMNIVPGP